jgi:hypothetical protein
MRTPARRDQLRAVPDSRAPSHRTWQPSSEHPISRRTGAAEGEAERRRLELAAVTSPRRTRQRHPLKVLLLRIRTRLRSPIAVYGCLCRCDKSFSANVSDERYIVRDNLKYRFPATVCKRVQINNETQLRVGSMAWCVCELGIGRRV